MIITTTHTNSSCPSCIYTYTTFGLITNIASIGTYEHIYKHVPVSGSHWIQSDSFQIHPVRFPSPCLSVPIRKDRFPNNRRLETKEQKRRERKKVVTKEYSKQKATPTFNLVSEIEIFIDIRNVLEARIRGSNVDLILKELLGITKNEFHEVIIDLIQRMRQVTDEARGVKAINGRR